jgi:hypothetical protein
MIDPDLMKSINRRAYEIWESEGKPEGRARIHWLRAEAEFREKLCHRELRARSLRLRRDAPPSCDTLRPPPVAREVLLHRPH